MKYIVDRIEGEYAVCEAENKSITDIPFGNLPPGIKEGDHIIITNGKYEFARSDPERKEHIKKLMDDSWGN